jgi:HEAT repeat protein
MKQSPFEFFLDRLDPARREDQLAFFRIVAATGPEAVKELALQVHRVSCALDLKRLTLEFSYYFPWPEWCPVIDRILRHEKDLDLFETGVRALGRMRIPAALAALRNLSLSRATPGFREIVDEVLHESDPAEAFQHHFSRLLQGSAQAADANEGAHQLAKLLTPDSLEALKTGVSHPDPLIFRHALRLVGQIPSKAAAEFLLDYLKGVHRDTLEDREARALLTSIRNLPRPELQEKVIQVLTARWNETRPGLMAELATGQPERIHAAAAAFRQPGLGILDTFLIDTLLAAAEEKAGNLAKHLSQAGDAAQQRARRLDFAMDATAQSLAAMATRGLLEVERLLPALAEPLRCGPGNPGVASALAQVLPASGAQELIDLLVNQTEGVLRNAAMEVMGARKEEAFRPALLKWRLDAIADIADRSLWHLGQLHDPAGTARALLEHPSPEEVQTGLRFISMHRLDALVPDLLERIETESREAVLIATFETLGNIGCPRALEPLLALLHSGQGSRIQAALAAAIRDLGHRAGALQLCAKAKELNSPGLHTVAVEALARAYGSADQPLRTWDSDTLLQAIRAGWSGRNPWPSRRRIADALLAIQVEDPAVWVDLASLVRTTLGEKRQPGSVLPEDLAHLQSFARFLAQKTQS